MFRLLRLSPPSGWRAVGWELAIVTLGVLIALAAQQWAEDRASRRRAAAAEEAMVLEIENSLLASAELIRLDRCWEAQLLGLQTAIISGDRSTAARIVEGNTFGGAGRLWADNAFQAALTAQISDYLGSEKLKRYSQVYDMIRLARVAQAEREASAAVLTTLSMAGAPESPEITHALLTALAEARARRITMLSLGHLIAMFAKKDLGLEITRAQYLAARGRTNLVNQCEQDARLAKDARVNSAQ